MTTSVFSRCPLRLRAALCGGFGLVLVLGAAASSAPDALAGTHAAARARAAASGGVWGQAQEVPGLAALNAGGGAQVFSVWSARAGEWSAGGSCRDGSGLNQGFVAGEADGGWGQAGEGPGVAALNAGGGAQVFSVSCARGGECSAGGSYGDGSGPAQGFVAGETNGVWGQAVEVPGLAVLNTGGFAQVFSV